MPVRSSQAIWEGSLREGIGTVRLGSDAIEAPYSFDSRFQQGAGTNPEELVAAAHAGCFSMALAHVLASAGYTPIRIETTARVHLEKRAEGFSIPRIDLTTEGDVPGIDRKTFQDYAEKAKRDCPISRLLAAAEITLDAQLLSIHHE